MRSVPLKTFIIYAHEDLNVRDTLHRHLQVQVLQGTIDLWGDYEIMPGEFWNEKIKEKLAESEILLLVVSSDFFSSEYIQKVELPEALKRHQLRACRIIPVIARECDWEEHPIGKIQVLPPGGMPIDSKQWDSRDEPYRKIIEGIKSVVKEVRYERQKLESLKLAEAAKLFNEQQKADKLKIAAEQAERLKKYKQAQRQESIENFRQFVLKLKSVLSSPLRKMAQIPIKPLLLSGILLVLMIKLWNGTSNKPELKNVPDESKAPLNNTLIQIREKNSSDSLMIKTENTEQIDPTSKNIPEREPRHTEIKRNKNNNSKQDATTKSTVNPVEDKSSTSGLIKKLFQRKCPDSDLDGICDSLDRCKDVKGISRWHGCPDSATYYDYENGLFRRIFKHN